MDYRRGSINLYFFMIVLILLVGVEGVHAQEKAWWKKSVNVESKAGTDRSIQSLDIQYPLSHTVDSLSFTDLRGRIDDDQSVEINLGLAHRFVAKNFMTGSLPGIGSSDEAVLGFYGFADRLESEFDNTFYQATAGFEYFTKDYSLRINGYYPEDDREPTTTFTQLQATGTQIFFENRQNFERPLPGYDVELGRTLRFDGWQLYGRGSYFRFHHSDVAEVEGTRLRTGVQLPGSTVWGSLPEGSQLTLGAEWQTDQVRDEQTFGVFRLSVPFGGEESGVRGQESAETSTAQLQNRSTAQTAKPPNRTTDQPSETPSWVYDRLTERVERDVDIVTGQQDGSEVADTQPAVLAGTGEKLTDVAVAQSGKKGKGTAADPGSLASAVNRAGTDGTVFVIGKLKTDGVLVPGRQKLIGGNRPVIQSADGKHVAALGSVNQDAVIEGTPSAPILRLGTGTAGQTIRGLSFRKGKNAVRADEVDTLTINNVTVENTAGDAIHLNKVDNATIKNSSIHGTLHAGDTFSGRIATSQVGALAIGRDATGRMEDVRIRSGKLTVGADAGRGAGNLFALRRVNVESGNLRIGENAGAENGRLRMDTVTVADGFLELEDHAAGDPTSSGNGGTATLTNITTGDSLSVGAGAGIENGSFTMKQVRSGGTVTIDPSAGEHGGSFTVEDLASDGVLEIGSTAGAHGGAFTMTEVTSGGSLDIGANVARYDGSFSMKQVNVSSGDLVIGDNAGSVNGTFRMDKVTVSDGSLELGNNAGADPSLNLRGGEAILTNINVGDSLSIGQNAGRELGSLRMEAVTTGGKIEIGSAAGGKNGSFEVTNVSSGGGVVIGPYAGRNSGGFVLDDVDAEGSITIDEEAGVNDGAVRLSGVSTGDSLTLGHLAGENGIVLLENLNMGNDLTIADNAAVSGGTVVVASSDVGGGVQLGTDFEGRIRETTVAGTLRADPRFAGALRSDTIGHLAIGNDAEGRVKDVTVTDGNLTIDKNAGRGTGDTFVLTGVDVLNGDLSVGANAGGDGGSFTLSGVTVGDTAAVEEQAGSGGTFQINGMNVNGQLSIEDEAGQNGGSFTMRDVNVNESITVLGFAASYSGSFTMTNVTVNDSISVDPNAATQSGSFTMSDLKVGNRVTVKNAAALFSGSFALTDSRIREGVSFGKNAGRRRATLNILRNTIPSGDLSVAPWGASASGTIEVKNNTVGGTIAVQTPTADTVTCGGNTPTANCP